LDGWIHQPKAQAKLELPSLARRLQKPPVLDYLQGDLAAYEPRLPSDNCKTTRRFSGKQPPDPGML
jgi:hypothetical protein